MEKVKPAIYQTEFRGDLSHQSNWGWVDLDELVEIIGCPPEEKEELLLRFERVGGFFSRRKWSGERNKVVRAATREEKCTAIENINVGGKMGKKFVPAGWALAVIEEVKAMRTNPEKLQRQLDDIDRQQGRIKIAERS